MNLPRHIVINEFALMRFKSRRHNSITMDRIGEVVSQDSRIPLSEIKSKNREMPLPELRQVILYLGKENKVGSLGKIASYIGQKHDYTIYSVTQVNNRMETDKDFKNMVDRIKKKL